MKSNKNKFINCANVSSFELKLKYGFEYNTPVFTIAQNSEKLAKISNSNISDTCKRVTDLLENKPFNNFVIEIINPQNTSYFVSVNGGDIKVTFFVNNKINVFNCSKSDIVNYLNSGRKDAEFMIANRAIMYALGALSFLLSEYEYTTQHAPKILNKKRSKDRVSKYNDFIYFTANKLSSNKSSNTGTIKAPHVRRGHKRTLKSGKVIYIKPCSIHGGEIAKNYTC